VHQSPARGHYALTKILDETERVSLPGLRGRSLVVGSMVPARKASR
jgi:hypothetical protein